MKRGIFILLVLLAIAASIVFGSLPLFPQTPGGRVSTTSIQRPSMLVATVTADASAPTMTWTVAKTTCVRIPVEWSNVTLSFYGYGDGDGVGSPDNATFSFDVYVCDIFGGWECVSSGNSGTIGAQKLSHDPVTGEVLADTTSYCWADDINEGTKKTSSTIAYSDYESNDGLAKMKFDRHSAYGVYVRIYSMTAQSVTSVSCLVNGFNQ